MGHGHPSEKHRAEGAVCGACGGVSAPGKEPVTSLPAGEASLKERQAAPGVRVALFVLSVYKAYLSVLFAGTCRFEPTCSRYAYEAVERFGVLRGSWLALKRLARCQPLSRKFGYDPVPESWEAMQSNYRMAAETREGRS